MTTEEGIIIVHDDGSIKSCNRAAGRIFGYRNGALIRKKLSTIIPQAENGEQLPEQNGVLTGRHRDGSTFPLELTVHREADAHIVVVSSEDNTKTKYQALFNRIADPVIIFDQETYRILDWNSAFLRVYGYTQTELRTMTPFDLHPSNETEKVRGTINVKNVDHTYQYTHLTKSGKRLFVETLTDELEYQGRPAWITIIRDITRRKLAEEKLRGLSRAVEQSPSSVVITDTEGHIEYVNPKFTQLTGYSAAEVIGQNPNILKSDKNPAELYRQLWETITSGKEWRGEFCNKKKNGELFWEIASISPIRDSEGNITHYIGVKEDITERKQAEEELQRAKEAAEQAAQAKSQFLANMSHEIRTPLNAIMGMTELALETQVAEELKSYLEIIQNSSENLLGLVDDILDFSKIEAGQIEIEVKDFAVQALVENVAEMFGQRASTKGVELVCHVQPDIPRIQGDRSRIRQVLINLLENAVKFTDKGEIVLKVLKRSGSRNGTTDEQTMALEFIVSDTGVGITKKNIDKIFQSFSQEDSSIKRKFGGSGLGLSISKALIELMGGELQVQSKPGKGSTFSFRLNLPCTRNQDRDSEPAYPVSGDVSVLLVDDNDTSRQSLRETLTYSGIDVIEAASGPEALALLNGASKPVALAIVDQQMPEMDGVTLIKKIRGMPEYAALKTILLSTSGHSDSALKEVAEIAEFIYKPVKQSGLRQVMMRMLGERAEASSQDTTLSRGQTNVLLAEDNLDNQRLAKTMLEKSGYLVEVADNGKKALERVQKTEFDVILMDIYMPVMDGLEATRRIREWESKNERTPTVIIAVTAHAIEGYREKCLANGMNDFIAKPIRKKKLVQKISAWLEDSDFETDVQKSSSKLV